MINCNRIIVFICTDAWAPICIFLHVSGQNESVHIKTVDTLYHIVLPVFVTTMMHSMMTWSVENVFDRPLVKYFIRKLKSMQSIWPTQSFGTCVVCTQNWYSKFISRCKSIWLGGIPIRANGRYVGNVKYLCHMDCRNAVERL